MINAIPDPRNYARERVADLPWGYWLRKEPDADQLIDEDGKAWMNLRHCLWFDRLGMSIDYPYTVDRGCDVLLAVLHALMNRERDCEVEVGDLFRGAWEGYRHYMSWAQGQGIIQGARVTVEGRAIARMLAATRRPDGDDLAPLDFPTLSAWNALDCGVTQEQREKIMAVQEAMGRALRYRFVREPVAGLPGIKLLGHEIGHNIPLTRVLWSLAFPDDYARDRLFAWLGDRLDRWQNWGRMAADGGSRALSEHLLKLKFAGEPINLG
jgi:hypothetical protein